MEHKVQGSAVVFTLFYPYSTFDYYVDFEIELICKHFKTVYIIPISIEKEIERKLPQNAILVDSRFTAKPVKSLIKAVFSYAYWNELFLAFKHKKLNNALFKHLTLQHAKVDFLKQVLQQKLTTDSAISWVYSHWLLEGVYAAGMLKEKYGYRLITKAHSLDIYKERHINTYIPFLENAVKQVDQIHFISDLGKIYFNSTYNFKLPHTQQFVSRLGIQNNIPLNAYETKGPLKIISVSYIYPLKRVDLILEAISKVSDFHIEWYHIGAYYKDHTAKIKRKAEVLLKDKPNIKVVWLGDFSIPQVYAYYAAHAFDLFISTSSSEGIPVSMMECMSFGIPVMSTDVGGVKEIVAHGVNGILLDEHPSAESIAKQLIAYYELNQQAKTTMRIKAYEKWKTSYNAETNFQKFLATALVGE